MATADDGKADRGYAREWYRRLVEHSPDGICCTGTAALCSGEAIDGVSPADGAPQSSYPQAQAD